MKNTLLFVTVLAATSPLAFAQTYLQETYESSTVGQQPDGTITFSPSTNTASNGAVVVDSGSTPSNPLSGKSLYLFDLAGDLSSGEPTHLRADFNGGTNVSNVRVDFDFRRGIKAIDTGDADTRYHFALGRSGDSLNNSDFRPFEIRIVNNGDLVVNSLSGSSSVGTHLTAASNRITIMANSHETNSVDYSDATLGSGSVAPNTLLVFLNGNAVGTFDFHQTPDPANAPQVDFKAQNEDLGQYAFYQDSKRQGEVVVDNLTIAAMTAPIESLQGPTGLAASSPDSFTVNLTWTDAADDEGEYRVERKSGSGAFAQVASLSANSISYSDESVSDGTSYVYRVLAASGTVVSDPSNEVSIATTVQVAPVIRSTSAPEIVVAGASASVTVTTAGQGILSYQWYRGSSGSTGDPVAGATSPTLTLPGLATTTTVWVRVTNASGSVDGESIVLSVRTAGTSLVNNATELASAIAAAGAGDTILLADGTWADLVITLVGQGTTGFPITVGAQTPGKVILTGSSRAEIGGNYLQLRDLVFSGAYSGNENEIIQFRASGVGAAEDSRVTNITLLNYVPASGARTAWVALYGKRNRLDHSYLKGHDVSGVTVVVWADGTPNDHLIDSNHFADRKEGGENGWETIRVGTSDVSMTSSRTTVEHNLFTRVDGEIEIISNKTHDNIYRYNTFLECSGTLTLRHGNGCLVDSNFFLGRGRSGSGGVRVIGENHVIVNNHFEETNVRSGAAITVYAGVDDGALNEYFAANNVTIANNTFVDNQGPAIEIGTGLGSSDRTVLPTGGLITNNVMVQTGSAGGFQVMGAATSAPTWTNNLISGGSFGSAPAGGFVTADPVMTFDPLRLVSLPSATGPVAGAATGSLSTTALDIEGRARGASRDLGAFEVSSLATNGLVFGSASTLTTGPTFLASVRVLGTPNARFVNSSVRAVSDSGEAVLTNGFVIGGTGLKSVLVRTVGPGLDAFGVTGVMPSPNVVLFNSSGTELESNTGWENGAADAITRASAKVGAFPLVAGTADSALVTTLSPGAYTAQVVPGGGVAGTVLVEVYDLTPGSGNLVNQSARGEVSAGQAVLVAGFVINGSAPRRALVRCAGPALGAFGVNSAIENPEIKLFNSDEQLFAANDDWDAGAEGAVIRTAAQTIGAFAFADGSKDAAILVTLEPGLYTAHASGVEGATGTALLEVYLLAD